MRYTESLHQASLVAWFRAQYPYYKNLLVHIPNGQNVGSRIGARLKAQGLMKGYPDLALFVPRKHPVLFIEMKSPKGRLTLEQKMIHEELREVGYRVETCYSVEDGIEAIRLHLHDGI